MQINSLSTGLITPPASDHQPNDHQIVREDVHIPRDPMSMADHSVRGLGIAAGGVAGAVGGALFGMLLTLAEGRHAAPSKFGDALTVASALSFMAIGAYAAQQALYPSENRSAFAVKTGE